MIALSIAGWILGTLCVAGLIFMVCTWIDGKSGS